MKKIIESILIIGFLLATSTININAFESKGIDNPVANTSEIANTVVSNSNSFNGYILYTEMWGGTTYLVKHNKQVVHRWYNLHIGLDVHLLENGNLLHACYILNNHFFKGNGCTGRVEIRDWNNTLLWEFEYSNDEHYLHHDIEPLPNGNILMIAYEKKTHDEAINAGRNISLVNDNGMWPDHIIEVQPTYPEGGNIVWEWHAWDHLIQDYDSSKANYGVVADHPELIDINSGSHYCDWLHTNSIDYNKEFDQILLSPPKMNEIWVIDHSTTTQEAASHTGGKSGKGGDILYRWGNPENYRAGNNSNQQFFFQHDARWIEPGCPGAGHITVFNSQNIPSTSVDEIIPPVDKNGFYYLEPGSTYGPEEPIWSISSEDPYNFESRGYSGAQRLPDGNTLISSVLGCSFFVVTPEKNLVWKYIYSLVVNQETFKMEYYPLDYPGLNCLSLSEQSSQSNPIPQSQSSIQTIIQPATSTTQQYTTIGSTTISGKTTSK